MIDNDKSVLNAYGINPLSATYLIDKNGIVVKYYTGQQTEQNVRDFIKQIKS
jgi:cytochrome oxidase Cu insertion factor (SCO1/SenC/PrrC family)